MVAESRGFIRAAQASIEVTKKEAQSAELSEERIERVSERIESGDLDPEARRKVGTRPETLKSIRQAQEKLEKEKDT